MKKREIFILSSLAFSLGMVIGFLISPVKQGINSLSVSTSNNYNYNDKKAPTTEKP